MCRDILKEICSDSRICIRGAIVGFRIAKAARVKNDDAARPSNSLWYAFGVIWHCLCCWHPHYALRSGKPQRRHPLRWPRLRQAVRIRIMEKKAAPVAEEPPPAPVPLMPEQMPPTPPHVTYQNGLLTIDARNSTLSQVLRAVQVQTGVHRYASQHIERTCHDAIRSGTATGCPEHDVKRIQI